jgi:EmrB/QacA subfamily drug resistance transporter
MTTPRRTQPLVITTGLCLAAFIISLDVTIVNVALPTLVRSLGASTTGLQWVVDAYNLAFAAAVLAAGSISDRLGRKGTLLAGIGVFALASLAGAASGSELELVTARAVMGLGAALMFPSTLSLLVNVFVERGQRAKAIGLWGATTGIGIATGPIVGGWLLERFWWGSIFVFLAIVAAVVAALVAFAVPTSRDERAPRIDWPGLVISSAGMATLVLGVIQAPRWGWGSAPAVLTMAGGLVTLVAFVVVERRSSHPMVDVALFHNPRFTAASGSVAIAFFALQGFIFLITQYFQFVKDFSPLGTGVRLLPVAVSVAVGSVAGTRVAVRAGNKAVVALGMVSFAVGLLWTSTATESTSYVVIVGQMLFLGLGMGLTSAPATEAIMGAVPQAKAGVGSAVNDATRLFGGTLGVAVIGSVATSLYTSQLATHLPTHLPPQALSAAKGSLGGAMIASDTLARLGLGQVGHQLAASASSAFIHSLSGGSLVAAGVVLAGALVAALLLPARPRRSENRPPEPARVADPELVLEAVAGPAGSFAPSSTEQCGDADPRYCRTQ